MNRKELNVAVLCGGTSSEREVSLRSGAAVCRGLIQSGYQNVRCLELDGKNWEELLRTPIDLAFLALHGKGGEDGTVQGLLELAGIPYTGSSVEASANCINKIRTKELLCYAGLPTPAFRTLKKKNCRDVDAVGKALVEELGLPLVLKAPCEGSSIGVRIVRDEKEISEALDDVLRYGDEILAEEYLSGTELTLPILGNEEPIAFPGVEITSENEFYDYQAKYTKGMCHHIIPARISEETESEMREMGKRAYALLGCSGFARIDFILDHKKGLMIIEINTIPGMTEMSLFPDSAAFAGVAFPELVDRVVGLACQRFNLED